MRNFQLVMKIQDMKEVIVNVQMDKLNSPSIYPKSCIYMDVNSPEGSVCPQDSKDLIRVPVAQCKCCSIGDPRSGLTIPGAGCPEYCTDNIYNGSCTCGSYQDDYTECVADKAYILLPDCNGVHGSAVKSNIYKCIDGYISKGCTCPRDNNLNQFDGYLLDNANVLMKMIQELRLTVQQAENVVVKIYNQLYVYVQ
ncbi:MAG: hypothetical protein EZS28_032853, partial [Streblomastix strix]